QGDTGPQGEIGFQGLSGPQGVQGVSGPQGVQGAVLPLSQAFSIWNFNSATLSTLNEFSTNDPTLQNVTSFGISYYDIYNVDHTDWFAQIQNFVQNKQITYLYVIEEGNTPTRGLYKVDQVEDNGGLGYDLSVSPVIFGGTFTNGLTYSITWVANGSMGETGSQGETGPQGDFGPQGEMGLQGDMGPQGFQGETGPQGFQGDMGPQGDQGDMGPQGFQGIIGFQGQTGPQGRMGNTGLQGYSGPQGEIGYQGDTGPQGFQGDFGLQGMQGPLGNPALNITFGPTTSISVTHSSSVYPLIQLIDTFGNTFIPNSIIHTSTSEFILNFATESSGTIIIGGGAGPQGEMGVQGYQGEIGPQGDIGFQGISGPQG
ncbi:MAG: collagen-like protein, partial [Micrococcales bacterium]|nr:collagen-like protein [Micrococcales bacterium]